MKENCWSFSSIRLIFREQNNLTFFHAHTHTKSQNISNEKKSCYLLLQKSVTSTIFTPFQSSSMWRLLWQLKSLLSVSAEGRHWIGPYKPRTWLTDSLEMERLWQFLWKKAGGSASILDTFLIVWTDNVTFIHLLVQHLSWAVHPRVWKALDKTDHCTRGKFTYPHTSYSK